MYAGSPTSTTVSMPTDRHLRRVGIHLELMTAAARWMIAVKLSSVGDTLEAFQLAEEILDQVPPFIKLVVQR